jgi:hypothetical protein
MKIWRLRRCCMMWSKIAAACRGCAKSASKFGRGWRRSWRVHGFLRRAEAGMGGTKKDYLREVKHADARRDWFRRPTNCITSARFWPITGRRGSHLGAVHGKKGRHALVLSRLERRISAARSEPHHARTRNCRCGIGIGCGKKPAGVTSSKRSSEKVRKKKAAQIPGDEPCPECLI